MPRRRHRIDVVVVESHHDALEHVHAMIRRHPHLMHTNDTTDTNTATVSTNTSGWSMLHWDSHADLACPGPHVPAVACAQPRKPLYMNTETKRYEWVSENENHTENSENDHTENQACLYDLLDATPSGISEWILPLVWAAQLRRVHWIRPTYPSVSVPSVQIPTGVHTFHVGAWTMPSTHRATKAPIDVWNVPLDATLRVDWEDCVYYQQDNSVVPTCELLLPQPLTLHVTDRIDDDTTDDTVPDNDTRDTLPDDTLPDDTLPDAHRDTDPTMECYTVVDICLDYFACWNPFLTELDAIQGAAPVARALQRAVTARTTATPISWEHIYALWTLFVAQPDNATIRSELVACYTSHHDMDTLHALLCDYRRQYSPDTVDTVVALLTDAVPHCSMPHMHLVDDESGDTGIVITAKHRVIAARLAHFADDLQRSCPSNADTTAAPLLVTMARSVEDGFTPRCVVDELQACVLEILHSHFCACDGFQADAGCRLCVRYDYEMT